MVQRSKEPNKEPNSLFEVKYNMLILRILYISISNSNSNSNSNANSNSNSNTQKL